MDKRICGSKGITKIETKNMFWVYVHFYIKILFFILLKVLGELGFYSLPLKPMFCRNINIDLYSKVIYFDCKLFTNYGFSGQGFCSYKYKNVFV